MILLGLHMCVCVWGGGGGGEFVSKSKVSLLIQNGHRFFIYY